MSDLTVRPATLEDARIVAALVDAFAKGHPAEKRARSVDAMREAFWGEGAVAKVLLAERGSTVVGFGLWRMSYDVFWSMFGGEAIGLYVVPEQRGRGVAACIIAAMCAGVRERGGHFLQAFYDPKLAALYERVGLGSPERSCHISADAFEAVANLAGRRPRDIVPGAAGSSVELFFGAAQSSSHAVGLIR